MKRFSYVVSTKKGAKEKGEIQAASLELASDELMKQGFMVISIVEENQVKDWFWNRPKLSFEEKMMFTKHLGTMLKVGISIVEALDILRSQTTKKKNAQMYSNLIKMINSGQNLSKSLREYEGLFSRVFVNMVETGEESGTLVEVLEYLNLQLEKEYELRKRVVSAFVYPSVIIAITIALTMGIVIFVMPKITQIFSTFEVVLPLPTRILIGTSEFFQIYPLQAFFGFILGVIVLIGLLKWKQMKPVWDWLMLKIPVFGRLFHYVNLARFSRTLNSLLHAGVPITRALQITASASSNVYYVRAITDAHDKVEQGGQFGESFQDHEDLFPPLVTKMFFIGEKSGSLETTTEHLATLYEQNVDSLTRNLTVLLEPILLVFMGTLVGGVAISIILPIYQLPNIIQG
jgi:type IV pilus assembly protein PilC